MMEYVDAQLLDGIALHVFDFDPVGVAVTSGSAHRLIYMNNAYRKIVGERDLGVPVREAFGDLRMQSFFTRLDRVLETGEPIDLENFAFACGEPDAADIEPFASIGISKISLRGGEPGLLIRTVDVTERVDLARAIESVREERRTTLQRFESLTGLQKQAIWVSDLQGRPTEPCPGWERYTGMRWEEYCGDGWLSAVHPDDRERTRRTWLKAVDQRLSCWNQSFRVRMRDGSYRHVRERGVPIVRDGQVVEWIGTIADVEEEWQEERRRKLLDQAAAATEDLAGLEDVLHALADVIVSTLADACCIYVLPDAQEESVPLTSELLVSIARTRGNPPPTGPVTFSPDSHFVEAVTSRRPVRWNFRRGEPPPGVARHVREWIIAAEVNSLSLVPVVVDGAVAAVVAAVVCEDREPLGAADVTLLQQMLNHAHAHLRNAMRFQHTQRVALALQHCLLPEPPKVAGLEIIARYQPCATSAEIGGDWYDSFVPPCGSLLLTIGDVAGHDLKAAVAMSQLRNMLRGLSMDREQSPGEILRRLNVATESLCPECVATCVLARLSVCDDGGWRLSYSVAGHPPPLLVTCDGEARYLAGAVNPLLGVGSDLPRTSAVAALPLQSTLLLYTDGLIEVPGEHLDSGLERLRRKAAALARAPLDDFCDGLLTGLTTACSDDIAMIAVRVPGT
ncbi:SpoIIE family protein phosphatase [Nonomuraea maritima]|uniref:SpoIIE family protein phosphatase n=1 Tax=Nonomuraea maritima TaxID=683260 RepID=UPI00371D632A